MAYTKDEVLNRLKAAYKQCYVEKKTTELPLPSVILKSGFKPDERDDIFALFGLSGYDEILEKSGRFEVYSPSGKTHKMVRIKQMNGKTTPKPQSVSIEKAPQALHERIKILLSYLNQNLYGKDEAVRLALLSAVAGESIFFMGPPGTAKSMVSRRIAAAFKDFYEDGKFSTEKGGYFEYLMNEFSTPDEICGPVDLSALNEKPSRYERQTEGYLPSAKIAFLDEIWKSGPAILNTLLTIINERKFHNGKNVQKVPLISLASASNELPEKNRGLEALWDRFILRVFVNPVANEDDFFKIIDDGNKELVLTEEQRSVLLAISDVEKWQAEINKVELSDESKAVISAIRKELVSLNTDDKHKDDEAYYVSDRRWKKIVHILKASAFLNGRNSVDLMDCSLIEYAIWNTDKQHDEVCGIVEKILKQNGIGKVTAISDISDQVGKFKDSVNENWFDKVHIPAVAEKPIEYKMNDGTMAYKIVTPKTIQSYRSITPYYIAENYVHSGYNRNGAYFDSNKGFIGDYDYYIKDNSLKISNNILTWTDGHLDRTYSCEIEMSKAVPAKDYIEQKRFEPVAKKTTMEAFDKEEYTPIVEQIDSEIADLQNFKAENEKPFAENTFSDTTHYCPVLLNKIDESIRSLEDLKLKLKEQHERYASDANVKSDFELGDIILKDGTYKKAGTKVNDTDIIAEVCMISDSENCSFGISREGWGNVSFEKAKEIADSYRIQEADIQLYSADWELPTIEQWKKIYQNRKMITHLEHSFAGRYWSSSVTETGAAYCFDFDKGEPDYTTPDHPYNVYLIRKLAL